jgi:hypothetical protein
LEFKIENFTLGAVTVDQEKFYQNDVLAVQNMVIINNNKLVKQNTESSANIDLSMGENKIFVFLNRSFNMGLKKIFKNPLTYVAPSLSIMDETLNKGKVGSSIKGALFGKDQVQKADDIAGYLKETQLRASQAQRSGLDALMAQSPAKIAESQISKGIGAESANLEDQRRQIQQQVARRGLQNTSIGLGSLLGAERGAGKNISSLLASQPMLERAAAQDLINAGAKVSSAQNVPIRFNDEVTRKKGIAGLLGTLGGGALGAFYGGPQGAAAGAQIGQGAGEGLSGIFG